MPPLIQLIIAEIPNIVAGIKEAHASNNPGVPPPTSQEVMDAFNQLFADDVTKDEALKAALQAELDAQQ